MSFSYLFSYLFIIYLLWYLFFKVIWYFCRMFQLLLNLILIDHNRQQAPCRDERCQQRTYNSCPIHIVVPIFIPIPIRNLPNYSTNYLTFIIDKSICTACSGESCANPKFRLWPNKPSVEKSTFKWILAFPAYSFEPLRIISFTPL